MFDAHTHLNSDQLTIDRKHHVHDFIDAWWTHCVTIWIDTQYNEKNIAICKQRQESQRSNECILRCTVGIHPCSVWDEHHPTQALVDTQIWVIKDMIDQHTSMIVWVWECGVDAHWGDYEANKKLQRYAFERQCEIASEYWLPIVIHSRSQRPDTLSILESFKNLKIYLHCRGYTPREVEVACTSLPNLWIGFCGNTTYPKAQDLRKSLQTAWNIQSSWGCRVLVETDAPYLAPQTYRWKVNTPAYLAASIDAFSQTLGIPKETFIETTTLNWRELYRL